MSMKDLQKAFKLIEGNKEKGRFGSNIEKNIIDKAEKVLSIKFPSTYRLFLEKYGYGGLGYLDVSGIVKNNLNAESSINVVWINLDQRKKWGLPNTHIIISDTGDGFWYVLDSSEPNTAGEYPVFIYYGIDEGKKSQEKVNEDFGEFLLEHTKNVLQDDD